MPTRALILAAGLLTTVLTLVLVWLLADAVNVMGLYLMFILPVGALIAGGLAGSGYGLASFKTGTRISQGLLVTVVGFQLLAYFAAQYVELASLRAALPEQLGDMSFFAYFDFTTQNFAFDDGDPLGAVGYLFRVLEVAGFAVGGLAAPFLLRSKAYCDGCARYMKTRGVGGLIPAGALPRKIKKKDVEEAEAFAREDEAAWQQGSAALASVLDLAAAGEPAPFRAAVDEHVTRDKDTTKRTNRISLSLTHCPSCSDGYLSATAFSGQGEHVVTRPLGTVQVPAAILRDWA